MLSSFLTLSGKLFDKRGHCDYNLVYVARVVEWYTRQVEGLCPVGRGGSSPLAGIIDSRPLRFGQKTSKVLSVIYSPLTISTSLGRCWISSHSLE